MHRCGALGLAGIVGGALAGIWAGPRLVEFFPLLDASRLLTLFRLGNRRDELGAAAGFQDVLGGLTRGVQLPVPTGALVG